MIQVHLLNIDQANNIRGKEYSHNRYFAPIKDANDNWIISQEEVKYCENKDFIWVKDLPLINWNPPIYDDIY